MVFFLILAIGGIGAATPILAGNLGVPLENDARITLLGIGSALSFLHGLPGAAVPNLATMQERVYSVQTNQLFGVILLLWGIVYMWLLWQMFRRRGRKAAIVIMVLWLIYAVVNTLFFSISLAKPLNSPLQFDLSQVNPVSLIVMFVPPILILALFIRDPRIHAYFGEGPYATAYGNWHSANRHGSGDFPSPWKAEVSEADFASLPKLLTMRVAGRILAVYHIFFALIMLATGLHQRSFVQRGFPAPAVSFLGDWLGYGALFQPTFYEDVSWFEQEQQILFIILAVVASLIGIGILIRRLIFRIPAIALNVVLLGNWLLGDFSTYTVLTYVAMALAAATIVLLLLPRSSKALLSRAEPATGVQPAVEQG